MVTDAPYRVEEHNGKPHAFCPYCSQMYGYQDEKGNALDIPAVCRRCGGPMDSEKAKVFANDEARGIRVKAAAMREAPRDKQIREAANKGR